MRRLGLLVTLFCTGGCYRLDTGRNTPARGTLGEEVLRILKQDLDRLDPPKGRALEREGARFVRGIDTLMPDDFLDALNAYLQAVLPLFDEQLLPRLVRQLACRLEDLSAAEPALQALWWMNIRSGYGEEKSGAILRRVLQWPELKSLLVHFAGLYLAHDGRDEQLEPSGEDDTLGRLLHELAGRMRRAEYDIVPGSTAEAVADFLLRQDARLSSGEPQWLARTDLRGRVRAALDSQTGGLRHPFVDADGDGLADIDERGDFVDAAGAPLEVPPPFAADGTRPAPDGYLLYLYADISESMLEALLRQLPKLIEDSPLLEVSTSRPVLFGEPGQRSDEQGSYLGYAPEGAPAYALAHAVFSLLDYSRAPELLEALRVGLELREPEFARLVHELDAALDIADSYPELSLAEHHRLFDDLFARLDEVSQRGYLAPMLASFSDPRALGLQRGFAAMIRYRDHLDDLVPGGMQFALPTDFSAPDSIYSNRSNLQKMMHLTRDCDGAEHRTEIIGFDVFTIPDMLVFWLDSAADSGTPGEGLAYVPWYVVAAVTEFDSEHPSAEQVNRFMNHDHDILGNPVGREGREILNYNGEALLAMEVSGLLDALRPAITALASRDRGEQRSGTKVLAGLLSAIHPHYSPNVPNASSACAGLRSLEPMLLDVLDHTSLVDALVDFLGSLSGLSTPSGTVVLDELAAFVGYLLQPDPLLRRHDGGAEVLATDELTPVAPISRLYLLLDAMRMLRDAKKGRPEAEQALSRLSSSIYRRLLEPEESAGLYRVHNREFWTFSLNLLDFLAGRLREHRQAGRLSEEIADLDQDVRDAVGGRMLPALFESLALIEQNEPLRGELDRLLLFLFDESAPPRWGKLRLSLAWLLQDALVDRFTVPFLYQLSDPLDPQASGRDYEALNGCRQTSIPNQLPSLLLQCLLRLSEKDGPDNVLGALLLNAGTLAAEPDGHPLHDFAEVIAAVHRSEPDATGERSPADYASILREVADYLLDERRGLEKLYQIVERRKGLAPNPWW